MNNLKLQGLRVQITLLSQTAVFALALSTGASAADNWMTWASTYTHEPTSGQRIDQYALPEQPYGPAPNAIQRSGYRNYRSTLQAGQSADNYHRVDEWGGNVQPYEQWRFPFRPYGVPYDAWGPQAPYGFFNGGIGYGFLPPGQPPNVQPFNNRGPGYPGNQVLGFPLQPQYNNQPWFDGTYPQAPPLRNLRPGFRERLPLRNPRTPPATP